MKTRQSGFTLLEMMIAVAVIGIIAAIAIPSYTRHVGSSHRAAVQAFMVDCSNKLERFHTQNMSFAGVTVDAQCPAPAAISARYTIAIDLPSPPVISYTLTATPTGAQTGEACGTLSLTNAGVRSASGTASSCW